MSTPNMTDQSFLTHAEIELKRAERYRLFISLIMIDLSSPLSSGSETGLGLETITEFTRKHIRASDYLSTLGDNRIALLFPETSRQGAEAAARRVTALIRQHIATESGHPIAEIVPMEMASYPDAAGARTIAEFLAYLSGQSQN